MTDNEIIKALECCGKNPPICIECSYKGKCNRKDCYDYLKGDALTLIHRQQAEIERLGEKNKRLFAENVSITHSSKEIKAEAIKEFAERLKGRFDQYDVELFCHSVIDNLVEEMVGDDK